MTPKEKADYLYNKMVVDFGMDKWQSKQCTLVAAEEIKNELVENLDNEISGIHAIYWSKVIQEIEKL